MSGARQNFFNETHLVTKGSVHLIKFRCRISNNAFVTSLSNYARSSIENLKRFWPFPLIYKIFYIPTTFLFFSEKANVMRTVRRKN